MGPPWPLWDFAPQFLRLNAPQLVACAISVMSFSSLREWGRLMVKGRPFVDKSEPEFAFLGHAFSTVAWRRSPARPRVDWSLVRRLRSTACSEAPQHLGLQSQRPVADLIEEPRAQRAARTTALLADAVGGRPPVIALFVTE